MPYSSDDKRRAYQRARKRQDRAGESSPRVLLVSPEESVETAQDVLDVLAEQVTAVRRDASLSTVERARCVGYLCSILLRAVETRDVVERLARVEDVLKERSKAA